MVSHNFLNILKKFQAENPKTLLMKSLVRWMLNVTFCPPRCVYDPDNTLCAITTDDNDLYIRTKYEFHTNTGANIMGSLWRDSINDSPSKCVIFLHSLGTNQFEVINIIPLLCNPELAVFSFDFPGCGLSEGEIIPLDGSGSELVKKCVDSLRESFGIQQFCLWGRSMGAAIALHTVSLYNEFCCVVSDSAFSCTEDVMHDQAKANKYPSLLVGLLMPIIRKEAKECLHTNVDVPFPIEYVPYARAPLLMGHGSRDTFVPTHQAQKIFKRYGVEDKQLYYFEAKHNSPRPSQWYQTAARFIYRHCGINMRARYYEYIYRTSLLHVGPVDVVISEIHAMEEERIRNLQLHQSNSENDENMENTENTTHSPSQTEQGPAQNIMQNVAQNLIQNENNENANAERNGNHLTESQETKSIDIEKIQQANDAGNSPDISGRRANEDNFNDHDKKSDHEKKHKSHHKKHHKRHHRKHKHTKVGNLHTEENDSTTDQSSDKSTSTVSIPQQMLDSSDTKELSLDQISDSDT